jgi:hypothetical protein
LGKRLDLSENLGATMFEFVRDSLKCVRKHQHSSILPNATLTGRGERMRAAGDFASIL